MAIDGAFRPRAEATTLIGVGSRDRLLGIWARLAATGASFDATFVNEATVAGIKFRAQRTILEIARQRARGEQGLDSEACSSCGSSRVAGVLVFRRETPKASAAWLSVEQVAAHSLCRSCFDWAADLMHAATGGASAMRGMLGVPFGAGHELDELHCNYCAAVLRNEAFALDLVPSGREFVRTSLFKHVGDIRQQRICRQCYGWWVTALRDSAALRGTSARAAEGPVGGWISTVGADAVGVYLLERDAFVLAETLQVMGHGFAPIAPHDVRKFAGHVFFVTAGRRDRATVVVSQLPEEARPGVIVIARPDCLADAGEALRAGAGDFLASPLSPQQIAGAFQRICDPHLPARRGARTGLPLYAAAAPRSAHTLRVVPGPNDDPRLTALLLRRFLRGYDRLGEDVDGSLLAMLGDCPEAAVDGIIQRLQPVLGDRTRITVAAWGVAAAA